MTDSMILVGGGGHCASCIEVISSNKSVIIHGIVDTPDKIGDTVMGFPVVGSDSDLLSLFDICGNAFITVGFIKNADIRIRLFSTLSGIGYKFPVISASTSYKAESGLVSDGTILMHQSMVNARTRIGKNCIINTRAVIEHDAVIGDNCHVSTGAIVNGACQIGDECFIGSASVIKQGVSIAARCIIGAGSVVIADIESSGVYVGNPARKIR